MSSNAKLGQFSSVKWNNNKVGDVKKIGSIPLENSEVDVTDLDSEAKEFIAGIKDYGTMSIEMNYVPSNVGQAAMEADAITGVVRAVEINLYHLNKTIAFNAYVKSFKFGEASSDGVVSATAELRISGSIAVTKADLTALAISDGTLTPAFSATKYVYSAIATGSTITVTPTLSGGTIVVTANGSSQTVTSGQASSAIALASGVTSISIAVSKNGGTSTYMVHIAKA
jgi:hypothetical protein